MVEIGLAKYLAKIKLRLEEFRYFLHEYEDRDLLLVDGEKEINLRAKVDNAYEIISKSLYDLEKDSTILYKDEDFVIETYGALSEIKELPPLLRKYNKKRPFKDLLTQRINYINKKIIQDSYEGGVIYHASRKLGRLLTIEDRKYYLSEAEKERHEELDAVGDVKKGMIESGEDVEAQLKFQEDFGLDELKRLGGSTEENKKKGKKDEFNKIAVILITIAAAFGILKILSMPLPFTPTGMTIWPVSNILGFDFAIISISTFSIVTIVYIIGKITGEW